MKVADAATTNTGVWLTFIAVTLLYAALGTTLILVLRGMSRRGRERDRFEDTDTPYGPPAPAGGPEVRTR
jgi:cytochrome d ubiquinol oxidase subunit I